MLYICVCDRLGIFNNGRKANDLLQTKKQKPFKDDT